jgi:hypothetical protein
MRHSAMSRLPLAAFVTAAALAFMVLGGAGPVPAPRRSAA